MVTLFISEFFRFSSNMSDQSISKKPDLGLLEEDDEFEEFPAEGKYNMV